METNQTLELAKSFETASFNPPQAQALASVTGGIQTRLTNLENGMREQRQDIRDLRKDMHEHRQETKAGFEAMRQEMQANAREIREAIRSNTWGIISTMVGLQLLFGGLLFTAFKLFFT